MSQSSAFVTTSRRTASPHASVSESKFVDRNCILWASDPLKKIVGPLKQEATTEVVTWYSSSDRVLVTTVIMFDCDGQEVDAYAVGWNGGAVDLIVAHRLHRLAAALPAIDHDRRQLKLAAVAATIDSVGVIIPGANPAEAEAYMKRILLGGYEAVISRHSDNLVRELGLLRRWGINPHIDTIQKEVIAGTIAFCDEFGSFGILSPDQYRVREEARAAVLNPVRQFLKEFSESRGETDAASIASLENTVLVQAARGIVDPDLLVGYAIYVHLKNAAKKVHDSMFQNGNFFGGLLGGIRNVFDSIIADGKDAPNLAAEAARVTRELLGENPSRDDQWLRWAIAGIDNDFNTNGGRQLPVTRTDLR